MERIVLVLTGIQQLRLGKHSFHSSFLVWGLPALAWAESRVRTQTSTAQEGLVPAAHPQELESHWWVQLSDDLSSSLAPAGLPGIPGVPPARLWIWGAALSISTGGAAWAFLLEEVCGIPVFFPFPLKAGINCQTLLKPCNL